MEQILAISEIFLVFPNFVDSSVKDESGIAIAVFNVLTSIENIVSRVFQMDIFPLQFLHIFLFVHLELFQKILWLFLFVTS